MAKASASCSDDSENEAIDLCAGSVASFQDMELDQSKDIWQQFYSERRKRHYYYNILTKKSVWDLPTNGSALVKSEPIDENSSEQTTKRQRLMDQPRIDQRGAAQQLTATHAPATKARSSVMPPMPVASASAVRKPWVIFDVNGTLASTTAQRQRRGAIQLRPGIAHIQRLQPYYRIALWSSMGARNMAIAVKALVERGQIGHVDLVLDRRACVQAPPRMRKNTWDTIKPLWERFGRFEPDGLARVVMVEDVGSKLVPSERPNLVLVPCWTGAMDHVVPTLVRGLIEVSRAVDLRAHTAMLSNLVGRLEVKQPATSAPKRDVTDSKFQSHR